MARVDELWRLHPWWTTRLEGIIESWIIVRSRRSAYKFPFFVPFFIFKNWKEKEILCDRQVLNILFLASWFFCEPVEHFFTSQLHQWTPIVIIFTRSSAGFNLRYVQSLPCFSLCMFNEAERSSIVYRDKRSASPSKRKRKKKKKERGREKKSSTPSQRTFLPRSQRGRLSVSSLRPLVSSASAKVSLPNSRKFRTLDTLKIGFKQERDTMFFRKFSRSTQIDFSICATNAHRILRFYPNI